MLKNLNKQLALLVMLLLMSTAICVVDARAEEKPPISASKTKSNLQSKTPANLQSKTDSTRKESAEERRRRKHTIPNFRRIRQLKSLTPAQKSKVEQILHAYREVIDPLSDKLRAAREADFGTDARSPDTIRRTVQIKEMRVQMQLIKRDTWSKLQKVLTVSQRKEIESGATQKRRRKTSDAPLSPPDSRKPLKK